MLPICTFIGTSNVPAVSTSAEGPAPLRDMPIILLTELGSLILERRRVPFKNRSEQINKQLVENTKFVLTLQIRSTRSGTSRRKSRQPLTLQDIRPSIRSRRNLEWQTKCPSIGSRCIPASSYRLPQPKGNPAHAPCGSSHLDAPNLQ